MTTRAEIEREMRALIGDLPNRDIPRCDGEWMIDRAVDVTERLLREQRKKWGHVKACGCMLCAATACVAPGLHEHRDPRCAPQEEK